MSNRFSKYLSRILLICILPVIFSAGCSGTKQITKSVRFALLGNTSPDSPFYGFNESLPSILDEIESRKPQIIIHTGNAIYGGSEKDGILQSDIKRQLNIFFPILKKLHTAVYTIPGDKDYYNNSPALFLKFSGKKPCYSFNYGSIHFISLSSYENDESFIDSKQLEWLKKDLDEFSGSNSIFIFTHHQLFPDKKNRITSEQKENLHQLFLKYNVKAVFSGFENKYTEILKDSIKYINAGCSMDMSRKYRRKNNLFYIVNIYDNQVSVEPVNRF